MRDAWRKQFQTASLVVAILAPPLTTPLHAQTPADAFQQCADPNKTPDEHIAVCTAATQSGAAKPQDAASAYINLGLAQNAKGRDALALDAFSKALARRSDSWEALINRGFVYLERGDVENAVADYARAYAIKFTASPGDTQAQHDDAIKQLHDGITNAYAYRCQVSATQSQALDSALAECNSALRFAPGSAMVLQSRGLVYFRRGDLPAAKTDFDAAIAADPKSLLALYVRGLTKLRLGDKDSGQADISAAKEMDSNAVDDFTKHGLTP